jgi:hypothetical protein
MSDLHTNGTANRAPAGAQDDIVERLRRCPEQFPPYSVRTDAAAEIERLRRRVERFNIALADLEHLSTERAVLHRIKEARRG